MIETSLIDWDGMITNVLFFDTCNFRCPFCQNWRLLLHPHDYPAITFKTIEKTLNKKRKWVDGVVLTGGEPLSNKEEILDVIGKIRKLNLKIKIDTHGAFPDLLRELIHTRLVDYIAVDIKAPLDNRYYVAVGKKISLNEIRESIQLVQQGLVDYEFRTTCVPGIIDDNAIKEIGSVIKGAQKWALQVFVPDNAYRKKYRKPLRPDYYSSLHVFLQSAKKCVRNTILRGKI